MIKVNVIPNNIRWKKYLKNPQNYLNRKIKSINKKDSLYRKKFARAIFQYEKL